MFAWNRIDSNNRGNNNNTNGNNNNNKCFREMVALYHSLLLLHLFLIAWDLLEDFMAQRQWVMPIMGMATISCINGIQLTFVHLRLFKSKGNNNSGWHNNIYNNNSNTSSWWTTTIVSSVVKASVHLVLRAIVHLEWWWAHLHNPWASPEHSLCVPLDLLLCLITTATVLVPPAAAVATTTPQQSDIDQCDKKRHELKNYYNVFWEENSALFSFPRPSNRICDESPSHFFLCFYLCGLFLNYHLFVCERKNCPSSSPFSKKQHPHIPEKKTHLSPYCAVISIQKVLRSLESKIKKILLSYH